MKHYAIKLPFRNRIKPYQSKNVEFFYSPFNNLP
jgi:hypothetical protein